MESEDYESHILNASGLRMIAIGVECADAVDELKAPNILGVKLTLELNEWTSTKNVILHLGKLTVQIRGTGHIIKYFGLGIEKLSCTGIATICNMRAEVGATTLFPFKYYIND
ncbi:hypothetical protein Glove_196g34 [Diversispora epigaea]|uniref:Aconitase/3-isopropylmalate dehydratase large subunit alpha/beta/alpha domain-containing protein n=1 Tax=Diversispora epigaea TaxID=1348612 RepID=A0A397IQH6_9GLOM|nr:hypothetical protein Glove_196g34 [Diversispora epigaea]